MKSFVPSGIFGEFQFSETVSLLPEENYFRLKLISTQGNILYSPTVEREKKNLLSFVYPNPASNQIHINWNSHSTGALYYQVFNSSPAIVSSGYFGVVKGKNLLSLPVAHLLPGYYLLVMEGKSYRFIRE
jgi:hypothetical protein